jgi:hypothetical protein
VSAFDDDREAVAVGNTDPIGELVGSDPW